MPSLNDTVVEYTKDTDFEFDIRIITTTTQTVETPDYSGSNACTNSWLCTWGCF